MSSRKHNKEAYEKAWEKIVTKAWTDEVFKQRLLHAPEQVFAEYGVEIPHGVSYKIHENTKKVVHLSLPVKPSVFADDEDLKKISGGRANDCPRPTTCAYTC